MQAKSLLGLRLRMVRVLTVVNPGTKRTVEIVDSEAEFAVH
jgi:hypothetical protein